MCHETSAFNHICRGFVTPLLGENRDDPYRALRNEDATGDYTAWLTYFLRGFSYQMVRIQELARSGA